MKVEEPAAAHPPGVPAPPEVVVPAGELVRKFPGCFRFRHPDARIRYLDAVRLVVENLRKYGDKRARADAREFTRCP